MVALSQSPVPQPEVNEAAQQNVKTSSDTNASFIPVVDISPIFGDDLAAINRLASTVKRTMEEVGFFQIRSHNFSEDVMGRFWGHCREFFDLSDEQKKEISMGPDYPYGYEAHEVLSSAFGIESKDGKESDTGKTADSDAHKSDEKYPDMKETFQICLNSANGKFPPRFPNSDYFKPASHTFKETGTAYYQSMFALSSKLLEIFALALDLPRNFFENKIQEHQSALRILNYPHQDRYLPGRTRASEHSDYGILTILKQDGVGGLQVRSDIASQGTTQYEWVDVKTQPDCFVVNIGDLMQRWTNDKWKSTVHRVISPNIVPNNSNRRQSIAFFFNANEDAVIETFPSCCDETGKSQYKGVVAGEYLLMKHNAAMGHKKE